MPVNPNPVYDDLNDEEIAAEQPLTESKMIRLRDNSRATFRNEVSVPYAELQQAEGMRTALAVGRMLVSDGAASAKMVDGGIPGEQNSADADTTIGNGATVTIDLAKTYLAWGHFNGAGVNHVGFCLVVAGGIFLQSTTDSSGSAISTVQFSISGTDLRFVQSAAVGTRYIYLMEVK